MPKSISQLYIHLIFSTKGRHPFLDDSIRSRVFAYMATVLRDMDSPFLRVGGVEDHVHIVMDIGKKHAPVAFVEKVKKESSKFIKTRGPEYQGFYWQRGYGMFSVSPPHLDKVIGYVENQKEHHRHKTFQEEYREFLNRYGVSYDERHIWD